MMQSDHLNESDSLHESGLHESGLHHRDIVSINVNNGGNGNGSTSPNNGISGTDSPTNGPRHRRPMNFWNRSANRMRIDVDDKYAKYGKKRKKRQNFAVVGAVCVASFLLGFAWMHFTHESSTPSSSHRPKPKLRHSLTNTIRQWKPHSKSNAHKQHPQKQPQTTTTSNNQKNSLNIPRFDTRKYVRSWERNARDAALHQIGQSHPQSVSLEGWHVPIAFRSFPYARQTHGPIKNLDSDYGDIAYYSLKNAEVFARIIPEDGGDDDDVDVVPGAFDPDSIEPERSLKSRNRKRRNAKGSYPELDAGGHKILNEDATISELNNYFDDDQLVHVWPKANDGKTRKPRACHRVEFSDLYFPTCNNFHERDLGRVYDDPAQMIHPRPENEEYVKYLAHGYYRDVWIMEDNPWLWGPDAYAKEREDAKTQQHIKYGVENEERTAEMVVKAYRSTALKTLQMKHPYNPAHWEEVQLEAIIMERMTKSPRIIDIYGHCGFSTTVEVVPIELEEAVVPGEGYADNQDVEKHNSDGVISYNNFTIDEKLQFALEMAESLADLHGFEGGVIVHDDVQICQWLRTADGHLKLGDFNRATIMQVDVLNSKKEEEYYCKFNNGEAFANYRAPEEFAARNLNEQIDTFSFGNNIYGMLTGLWNFYDTDDDDVVQKKLIDGKLPYVDERWKERSFGERKLIELMEKCWIYDPKERISIFDAVVFLKEAIKENEARKTKN